jgi:hypothetical protein
MLEPELLAVVESAVVVDSDPADSDPADSLVVWEVDSLDDCDVDSAAESPVAPALPGVRTVLPSVARVFRFAAVTSYETGVRSDMIYGPSSSRTVPDRIGDITVDLYPPGQDPPRCGSVTAAILLVLGT